MAQSELLKLKGVDVEGLFGIYDHRIDLNVADRVTILHGPNGVGKTSILRMIDALLRNDLSWFRSVPFSRFNLRFIGGSAVEVRADRDDADRFTLELRVAGQSSRSTVVDLSRSRLAETVAGKVGFLERDVDRPGHWLDVRDGEVLTETEVLDRYGAAEEAGESSSSESPGWLRDFLSNANVHLIETRRLEQSRSEGRRRGLFFPVEFPPRNVLPSEASVNECSRDFRERLDRAMADYGRQSQALDQSFPQRLLSATDELSGKTIKERIGALNDFTQGLKEVGILDETPGFPFDAHSLEGIDSTQARVMTLYVEDTSKKLRVLEALAMRARLLLESLNGKYRHKRLRLDRGRGIVAESEQGTLGLDSLSSGEQHELVLHYNLLFRVRSNTVVLIDEPELSLHVAWQKRFLPDLLKIGELSHFDALIATHSPYIAGERSDLMVPLGEAG